MLKYDSNLNAKPFLKWAGGKSQLLSTIENRFPDKMGLLKISLVNYILY